VFVPYLLLRDIHKLIHFIIMSSTQLSEERKYKVIIVGDVFVGKTSILLRAVGTPFTETIPTISEEAQTRIITRPGNKQIKLIFWDTVGQEKFKTISASYQRGSNACLIVYDITNRESFDSLTSWKTEINRYCAADIVVFLIGNKCDLSEESRTIPFTEGQKLAESWGCNFFETSAKTDKDIEEVVANLTDQLCVKFPAEQRRISLPNVEVPEKKKTWGGSVMKGLKSIINKKV